MSETSQEPGQQAGRLSCPGVRQALMALGCLCVALGVIGIFVPGLPTTVFLLIAAWAFSRSSERFHRWLYDHPRLGQPIRNWHAHRVIPLRAKLLAVTMMTMSVTVLAVFASTHWLLPVAVGALLACIAAYILSRPSVVPAER
jgi:uncharacterized membrane protein YbaN (DUF454 family)